MKLEKSCDVRGGGERRGFEEGRGGGGEGEGGKVKEARRGIAERRGGERRVDG